MFFKEHKNIVLLFAGVLGQNHLERFSEIENRIFRGDGGIGAAPRLAAAHRAADTNAPGGRLNQTPGEGACVSSRMKQVKSRHTSQIPPNRQTQTYQSCQLSHAYPALGSSYES